MTQSTATLSIENLTISHGDVPVVRNLSLTIAPGEMVGLVGESGSGKTSIGLGIMGLSKGRIQGKIRFMGRDLLSVSRDTFRSLRGDRIAMVFQDMAALHPEYPVSYQVAETLTAHGKAPKRAALDRAKAWLQEVGLPGQKVEAFPHQLSGGERQIVMIAMATISRPDLLILDEPVSFQDEQAKSRLIQWFRSTLKDTATLLITHDVSVATHLASRLLIICGGKVVEEGNTKVLVNHPLHPYTRALFRSNISLNPHRELIRIPGDPTAINRQGCPFQPRCVQAIAPCKTTPPNWKEMEGRKLACHRGGIVALLKASSLSKTFPIKGKRTQVIAGVSLSIHSGEGVVLMGPTGAGKSTLGAMMARLLKPDRGSIVSEFDDAVFRQRVQMIHQNPKEAVSPHFTVRQTIEEPLRIIGKPRPFDERIRKVLEEVGLPTTEEFLERLAHSLSGGELKRLVLARALVLDPLIIIADEPTAGVDASFAAQILRLLMTLQETRGMSLLLITHDPYIAQKAADRILYLEDGRIKKIIPSMAPVAHRHPAPIEE